ncbi:MAG: AAA family ATPase [Deltaproteobacteria bacterium]|nr:AAA family ATPase [Deltaproteobacteria bacterium]MBW2414714.1 AAA family ATPase [Deltaproteobacteria bacterium]
MNCPGCSQSLPDDAAFCGHCGASLASDRECAGCGRANPAAMGFCLGCGRPLREEPTAPHRDPRAYTPKHLADKILQSKSALEGERKQVTVLFADVQQSMELAGELDPEDWHVVLDRFFQILTDGVHRFEGTVNQYTGDGIMALFGAPIAHEDHAQRACYTALDLQDRLRSYADEVRLERGLNFSTRIGLNSGEVVVGKIGDDLRMDYTAQGQVVNVAQRMEQLAEPGRVYLTQRTADRVAGYFELREIGPTQVKGSSEGMRVHELAGPGPFHSRFDVSRARGLSKFVGREREMARLDAALERARSQGGQIVGIVADAGTGKSRLTYEFGERARAAGAEVLTASCPPHGKVIPMGLNMSIQRSSFGITDRDSAESARDKIAARLSRRDASLVEFIPFVMEFLGVAESGQPLVAHDAEARQREFLRYVGRQVDLRREPASVALLEDLHWIDSASQAVNLEIHRLERDRPYLVVMNFRPEYRPLEADWPNYEEIQLKPLSPESTGELLRDLLGPGVAEGALEATILGRAAGNPFFVEEIVQSLAESGDLEGRRGAYRLVRSVEDLEVPESVQAVLAARIDRLPDPAKQVLHCAAVIGREFARDVLETVSTADPRDLDGLLHELAGAEFIYQLSAYPQVEYAFKHPLTQQVAYEAQLRDARRSLHTAVARALEDGPPDRLEEQAALIAHHWEQASDPLQAARWTRRAAEHVAWTDRLAELDRWRDLLRLSSEAGDAAEAPDLRLAACVGILRTGVETGLSHEEASSVFAEGRHLADAASDDRSAALLTGSFAELANSVGGSPAERGPALIEEAYRFAEASGDPALLVLLGRGLAALFPTASARALELLDRSIAAARQLDDLQVRSAEHVSLMRAQRLRGLILMVRGRFAEAAAQLESVLELEQSSGYDDITARALTNLSQLAYRVGDVERAFQLGAQALELGERIGSANARAGASSALGFAHALNGAWDEARDFLERSIEISKRHNVAVGRAGVNYSVLAEAYLELGDLARAKAVLEEGFELGGSSRTSLLLIQARLVEVEEPGATDEIARLLDECARMIEETGWYSVLPRLHETRARLCALRGDAPGVERERGEALRLYTEMGATGHVERLTRETSRS